jgi:hypothetical protein
LTRSRSIAVAVLAAAPAACASRTQLAGARYVVLINDRRLPAITLAELRAEGLRYRFRLPS